MSGRSCFQRPSALREFQFTISNLPRRQKRVFRRWQPPPEGASSSEWSLLQISRPWLARGLGNSACSGCSASDTLAFPARVFQSGSLWSSLLVLPVGSILIVPFPFLWPFLSAQWEGSERSQESAGPACFAHHKEAWSFLNRVETRYPGRGPGTELLNHNSGLPPYKGGGGNPQPHVWVPKPLGLDSI